jgi:cell division protein ZapA
MGQKFNIKSDDEESYIREISSFVNEKVMQIPKGQGLTSQSIALLTALNIADELFKERQKYDTLKKKIKTRSSELLEKISQRQLTV